MTNRLNKIFACFLTLSLILALMPAGTPANAAASELFISEYIEGSSLIKLWRFTTAPGQR